MTVTDGQINSVVTYPLHVPANHIQSMKLGYATDTEGNVVLTEEGKLMTGLIVYGVPIGDEGFVRYALGEKAREVTAVIATHVETLADYPHHLMSMA